MLKHLQMSLVIKGKRYKVRYYARREDRTIVAIINTDELAGKYGDEWPVDTDDSTGKVTPREKAD